MSQRHVNEKDLKVRTSSDLFTTGNVLKLYTGIALLATSKNVSQVGVNGAIIGFTYILFINVYMVYILVKARNRFKKETITDICDLGVKLYGPNARKYLVSILVCNQIGFLFAYTIFVG